MCSLELYKDLQRIFLSKTWEIRPRLKIISKPPYCYSFIIVIYLLFFCSNGKRSYFMCQHNQNVGTLIKYIIVK